MLILLHKEHRERFVLLLFVQLRKYMQCVYIRMILKMDLNMFLEVEVTLLVAELLWYFMEKSCDIKECDLHTLFALKHATPCN